MVTTNYYIVIILNFYIDMSKLYPRIHYSILDLYLDKALNFNICIGVIEKYVALLFIENGGVGGLKL